jgi:hypothetical protein
MVADKMHTSEQITNNPFSTTAIFILVTVLALTAFRCRRRLRSLIAPNTFAFGLVGVLVQK